MGLWSERMLWHLLSTCKKVNPSFANGCLNKLKDIFVLKFFFSPSKCPHCCAFYSLREVCVPGELAKHIIDAVKLFLNLFSVLTLKAYRLELSLEFQENVLPPFLQIWVFPMCAHHNAILAILVGSLQLIIYSIMQFYSIPMCNMLQSRYILFFLRKSQDIYLL